MKIITLQQLKEHGACINQLRLFKQLFGKEVEVTVKRCVKYYDKFDWEWAAGCLLSDELHEEYLRIERLAWGECIEIVVLARREYLEIERPAHKEYEKIEQRALKEYKKKIAQAFGECYLKQ